MTQQFTLEELQAILENRPMHSRYKPEIGAAPIRAWRLFKIGWAFGDYIEEPYLSALHRGTKWFPGVNRAFCDKSRNHVAPHFRCSCGFYSIRAEDDSIRLALKMGTIPNTPWPVAAAQIDQWGIVIEHMHGWRSQYARIVPETLIFADWVKPEVKAAIEKHYKND